MPSGIEARRIAYSLADAQLGVLSRRQLIASSLTSRQIEYWAGSGYLLKIVPGVYSLGRPAGSLEALGMAGALLAGEGAIIGGRTAAYAWEIARETNQVEIVRPHGARRGLRGTPPHDRYRFVIRRGNLTPDDITYRGPLPLMRPARLLIDLAGSVSSGELRRFFIEAGRADLLTPQCLSRVTERSHGFNGRSTLLTLVSHWDPKSGRIRSILEGEFKLLCPEQNLPIPLTNKRVARFEVDALWPMDRLIVELDGRRFHGDAVALETDSVKTRELRALGYTVLRFNWYEVTHRPEWVADQIRRYLSSS